jgi:hypothetical protein
MPGAFFTAKLLGLLLTGLLVSSAHGSDGVEKAPALADNSTPAPTLTLVAGGVSATPIEPGTGQLSPRMATLTVHNSGSKPIVFAVNGLHMPITQSLTLQIIHPSHRPRPYTLTASPDSSTAPLTANVSFDRGTTRSDLTPPAYLNGDPLPRSFTIEGNQHVILDVSHANAPADVPQPSQRDRSTQLDAIQQQIAKLSLAVSNLDKKLTNATTTLSTIGEKTALESTLKELAESLKRLETQTQTQSANAASAISRFLIAEDGVRLSAKPAVVDGRIQSLTWVSHPAKLRITGPAWFPGVAIPAPPVEATLRFRILNADGRELAVTEGIPLTFNLSGDGLVAESTFLQVAAHDLEKSFIGGADRQEWLLIPVLTLPASTNNKPVPCGNLIKFTLLR